MILSLLANPDEKNQLAKFREEVSAMAMDNLEVLASTWRKQRLLITRQGPRTARIGVLTIDHKGLEAKFRPPADGGPAVERYQPGNPLECDVVVLPAVEYEFDNSAESQTFLFSTGPGVASMKRTSVGDILTPAIREQFLQDVRDLTKMIGYLDTPIRMDCVSFDEEGNLFVPGIPRLCQVRVLSPEQYQEVLAATRAGLGTRTGGEVEISQTPHQREIEVTQEQLERVLNNPITNGHESLWPKGMSDLVDTFEIELSAHQLTNGPPASQLLKKISRCYAPFCSAITMVKIQGHLL